MYKMKKGYKMLMQAALCVLLLCLALPSCTSKEAGQNGWELSLQSYTFHKFTLLEAFDKAQELGIANMEVFPGHKIGGKWGDQSFGYDLDEASRKELLSLAAEKGVRIVGCGVFVSDKAEEWEKMFRLAKDMGMEYISCEPPVEVWDIVEQLAEKNQIGIAVHNHPQPSTYWQPQLLLEQIGQRSKLLGSCADVGHWNRDGLDHLECLRSLEGRIHSLHFKDIIGPQPDGQERHDVIWGQGVLDVKAMLKELKQQHFSGYFTIEYEYNWENSVPDIRQCIDYFNQACAEMGE